MRYIFIFLVFCSFDAVGKSYLCIPDAAATVEKGTSTGKYTSEAFDNGGDYRFLFTNSSGSWVFQKFGEKNAIFLCSDALVCYTNAGFAGGARMNSDDLSFEVMLMDRTLETDQWRLVLMAGYCAKI